MVLRSKITWLGCGVLGFVCAAVQLQAQRGGRGGGAQGAPTASFPAQQRPSGDAAIIARGKTLYEIHCRLCHGADLRGGEQGGSNLLRSAVALNDQSGELLQPIIREGRRNPGLPSMPANDLSTDDIRAIAEYIHSILAMGQRQGGPPPAPPVTLSVLVGDANAGRAYFDAKCAGCHSTTGDLRGHRITHHESNAVAERVGCRRCRWPRRRNHSSHGNGHVALRAEVRRTSDSLGRIHHRIGAGGRHGAFISS